MPYKVRATVVSVGGHCGNGHQVSQSYDLEGLTPAGICINAFSTIIPTFRVLRFGGEFPWEEDKGTARVACPDAKNPVVFELRRIEA
ncbi:MAG: TIGR04076 family protein [Chloroflexi bacterium]|nr:TIGR04076 family protein [Chloroflexota bacterium]